MKEDEILEIINSGQRSNQPDILEMMIILGRFRMMMIMVMMVVMWMMMVMMMIMVMVMMMIIL